MVIYISCIERVARCGSGRDVVGTMNAARSRPDWLATVQSGRKQVQSRVCTPGFRDVVFCRPNGSHESVDTVHPYLLSVFFFLPYARGTISEFVFRHSIGLVSSHAHTTSGLVSSHAHTTSGLVSSHAHTTSV